VWNLIAALALAAVGSTDVTATKLDGAVASGRLESWTASEVVVAAPAGDQKIPAAELLSLEFSKISDGDTGKPLLELIDGSILPSEGYVADKMQAQAELQPPAPAKPIHFDVPLTKVRSVRLKPLDPDVLSQWREIRALAVPSDLIVVTKRGGQSLDHLECVLGEVNDKEVVCQLDGQEVRVPRGKVAGLVYYRSADDTANAPSSIVKGPDGLRVSAKSVRWQNDSLVADSGAGVSLTWPISGITSVDLSAGKLVVLSDLEPAAVRWQPLVSLPKAAERAAQFGQPRFNQSASGGPLTLAYPNPGPAGGSPQNKAFAKGISLRSRTELVYRLPAGYTRFLAEAGIEPAASASGNVMLSVFGDDRLLVEQAIDGSDAPVTLDLNVAGVKRLRILVDYGENLDTGDWLNLCNARIVK
jgi:NPCBM/NEW2 domain